MTADEAENLWLAAWGEETTWDVMKQVLQNDMTLVRFWIDVYGVLAKVQRVTYQSVTKGYKLCRL